MTIHYKTAKYDECFAEVSSYFAQHYQELSATKDLVLNPDYEVYKNADKKGALRVYLCYHDELIIGYIVFFISPNLHYKDCLLATEDIYYLAPEYRKGTIGIKLFKFAEKHLKSLGVNMIRYSTKTHMDNSALFEYLDCKFIEKVFVKRI